MNPTLQQLEKRIRELVPSLQGKHYFEDGYGTCKYCGVPRKWRDEKVMHQITMDNSNGLLREVQVTEYNEEGKSCTNNPLAIIQLHHVLQAVEKKLEDSDMVALCNSGGMFYLYDSGKRKPETDDSFVQWNLTLPLSGQSPEVWEYLLGMIK